jgi:hypothetical protein
MNVAHILSLMSPIVLIIPYRYNSSMFPQGWFEAWTRYQKVSNYQFGVFYD